MSKHIQLEIPKPCHANWNKMTPSEKGRFCNSCQKQVVDFTNMNDTQMAKFFKKTAGSVCGHFLKDQLNRDIEIPKKRSPWAKYFFQFAIPAFLVSAKAKAQGEVRVLKGDTVSLPVSPVPKGKVAIKECSSEKTIGDKIIRGKVINFNGEPLVQASVLIKGTTIGTVADISGSFQLRYNEGPDTIALIASYVGYQTLVVTDVNENENDIKMVLSPQLSTEYLTVGAVVVSTKRKKKNQTPLIPQKLFDTALHNFKLFPNPVPSGSNLNIEIVKEIIEGYYVDIISQTGQSVYQREIWIDKEARIMNVTIPAIKPGSYYLNLTDKKSKKSVAEKLIIQ